MIELNDLLEKAGLEPARKHEVLLMRHKPTAPKLVTALPWLAEDRHDIYNAYQSQHGALTEAALSRAKYLVSCIANEPGKALFVGMYSVNGYRRVTPEEFWQSPANKELGDLGTRGPSEREALWFDLQLTEHLSTFKGCLVIRWASERPYYQWAYKNSYPVLAIHDESKLVKQLPDWKELVLTWQELKVLPKSWKLLLAQWRCIYYIFDTEARIGYVGSASGTDNLIGRWKNYDRTGDGGNKLLRQRNPENFIFSILERVSPDMTGGDVIALEGRWKERLHTKFPYGLNDN